MKKLLDKTCDCILYRITLKLHRIKSLAAVRSNPLSKSWLEGSTQNEFCLAQLIHVNPGVIFDLFLTM